MSSFISLCSFYLILFLRNWSTLFREMFFSANIYIRNISDHPSSRQNTISGQAPNCSCFTCHISHVIFFCGRWGGGSGNAGWWRVCYQRPQTSLGPYFWTRHFEFGLYCLCIHKKSQQPNFPLNFTLRHAQKKKKIK